MALLMLADLPFVSPFLRVRPLQQGGEAKQVRWVYFFTAVVQPNKFFFQERYKILKMDRKSTSNPF
jgi:hypothetical protein